MRILGISRGIDYSPNLVGDDAAIFTAVIDELRHLGHEVITIREEEMRKQDYSSFDRVMTMARNRATLTDMMETMLTEYKDEELKKFFNPLRGSLACMSKTEVAMEMVTAGTPQPQFRVGFKRELMPKSDKMKDDFTLPFWMKNGQGPSTMPIDTIYCETEQDIEEALNTFSDLCIDFWLVQEHKVGDLIKFYGVEGTNFFHWQYASRAHPKFEHEKINGKEKGYAFDPTKVHRLAEKLAKKMQVPIYGGDAVIDEKGKIWFIDFNDFPSFSSCRDQAAKAIAERVIQG